MLLRKVIKKFFRRGNVCVTGLRGTGKDLLFGNVICRRGEPYASNLNYGGEYYALDIGALDCGGNVYTNFLEGRVNPYKYPYPSGSDVYVSDAGIYFPAQYCGQLNQRYGSIATYQALSRQVSHNNFHINTQNLNRVWDKIREQSDIYIRCRRCIYIPGIDFVIQFITVYDKAQSCIDRVRPCRITVPLFNKQAKLNANIYRDQFFNTHGTVSDHILFYFNKSSHDTYYFEKMMQPRADQKGESREKTKNMAKSRNSDKRNSGVLHSDGFNDFG